MKKFIMVVLIVVGVMFALSACNNGVATLANPSDTDDLVFVPDSADDYNYYGDVEDEIYDFQHEEMPVFGSLTGTVVSIEVIDADFSIINVESEYGAAVFMTNFNTFTLGNEPEIGDTITGHYLLGMPMIAIYPPQYNVSVIVNNDSVQDDGLPFVHVCRFFPLSYGDDGQLISADGQFIVNVGSDTEVILQNGEAFDGELAGRMLVVTYAITTRSLPPQAIPIQIVVLYEMAVTGPEFVELPDDWDFDLDFEPHFDIFIDGEGLADANAIFVGDDAIFPTHVPVEAVANAFGVQVSWDRDTNIVTMEGLNGAVSFVIGSEDYVVNGETVTIQASLDFYGTVYVPIRFFSEVFGAGSAYSQHGQIFINIAESDMR